MIQLLFFFCFASLSGEGWDCTYVINYIQTDNPKESYYNPELKHIFLYDPQDLTPLWREASCDRLWEPYCANL